MTIAQGALFGLCFGLFVLLFFLVIECLCKYLFKNNMASTYLVIYTSITGIIAGVLLVL